MAATERNISGSFADNAITTEHPHVNMGASFAKLPTELRLKIWACAVEPRVVILDDLSEQAKSYPLPVVTQLNSEARREAREGYERAGKESYCHFVQDILVCDASISDQRPSIALERLALRAQRLVFWDCFPDDGRIDGMYHYSAYLAACYPSGHRGKIDFDKFWFPNLRDLWIVKVGEVHPSWMGGVDKGMPHETRLRKTARQFRYWIEDNVVEIAPLDPYEAETKMILREGRCGKVDCQALNEGRPRMVSKVVFMDGKYDERDASSDGINWKRISPWCTTVEQGSTKKETIVNQKRWIIVERILIFSLRWDGPAELEKCHRRIACGSDKQD